MQVVIALVVTPEGLPLAYEVLPGNTADNTTTLRNFLARIERQYGKARRIWLMDRGIPIAGPVPVERKKSTKPQPRPVDMTSCQFNTGGDVDDGQLGSGHIGSNVSALESEASSVRAIYQEIEMRLPMGDRLELIRLLLDRLPEVDRHALRVWLDEPPEADCCAVTGWTGTA